MVQLTGKQLSLSLLDSSDFSLFIELYMCPKTMEHVYDPFTLKEAQEAFKAKSKTWSIESDSWLTLGICERANNEKIGSIGIKITDHQTKIAEVGFIIKPSAQGKGFAAEALHLISNYALCDLGLNKLAAYCSVNNTASYKLLEKVGFNREGCLKQNTVINQQYVDDYIYGLCKSDLPPL